MVKVLWTQKFVQDFKRVNDTATKQRILRQIRKTAESPEKGKPLQYGMKGEKTLYIKPYILIYCYATDIIILLRLEHKMVNK